MARVNSWVTPMSVLTKIEAHGWVFERVRERGRSGEKLDSWAAFSGTGQKALPPGMRILHSR